jgi:chromosome segregation ATPase
MEIQLTEQHKVQEELRDEKSQAQVMIDELKNKLNSKETEIEREGRRREKTQKELQDARVKLDDKIKQEEVMTQEVTKTHNQIQELEKQLNDARTTMEKYLRDYDALYHRTHKVTEDLEDQVNRNRQIYLTNVTLEKDLKMRNSELSRLRTEKGQLERLLEKEHGQVLHFKQVVEDSKTPLRLLQQEVDSLQKELLKHRKFEDQLERDKESVEKEKILQVKATERAEGRTREQEDLLREQERVTSNLVQEMEEKKNELQETRKTIYQLEKERERLGNESGEQKNIIAEQLEKIKLKDVHVMELQKKIIDWESKLKQQQQLYESVRTDRNHYSKQLIESQDEIAEMRKKIKIMDHQIEQLKEEIITKDQAIVKEYFDYQRVEKLREHIQNELNRKNLLLENNYELIKQQDIEVKRLISTIKRMDDEALLQRKEYDQVINERDILGTQLIRRNDELALLYEKLRVQQSTLCSGEIQYHLRLDDLKILRIKLKDLQRELNILKNNNHKIDGLKRDVLVLQKELLQERTKVTALSEELENPMNVHRWRKLEGSDPATFELIQKVQTLQKRLISKTEEVVEKSLLIQEKEKLYGELKTILARQPGPEVAEQLTTYQQSLKTKTRQMKAMASELNMYQAQINEYRYDVERLNRELQDMKRKYYQQKRKDQLLKDFHGGGVGGGDGGGGGGMGSNSVTEEGVIVMSKTAPNVLRSEQVALAKQTRTKFTGGGFAVK